MCWLVSPVRYLGATLCVRKAFVANPNTHEVPYARTLHHRACCCCCMRVPLHQVAALPRQLPFISIGSELHTTLPLMALGIQSTVPGACDIACRTCTTADINRCTSCPAGL